MTVVIVMLTSNPKFKIKNKRKMRKEKQIEFIIFNSDKKFVLFKYIEHESWNDL